MDRLNEISFNASVAGELRTGAVVQSLLDRGQLKTAGGYQRLRFHAISADGKLADLNLPSKFNTDWSFLENLKKRGRLKAGAGYMDLRFHMISADGRLSDLKLPSKFNTDWTFLQDLKTRGRAAADEWLKAHLAQVGEASSVDLGKAFL